MPIWWPAHCLPSLFTGTLSALAPSRHLKPANEISHFKSSSECQVCHGYDKVFLSPSGNQCPCKGFLSQSNCSIDDNKALIWVFL